MCVYIYIFMYTLAIKGEKKIFTIVVYAHEIFGSPLKLFLEIPNLFLINMIVSFWFRNSPVSFETLSFLTFIFIVNVFHYFLCTRQQFFMKRIPPFAALSRIHSKRYLNDGRDNKNVFLLFFPMCAAIQGGGKALDALSFRSLSAKEPLILGLFCI